jgi:hypothetical protein
MFLDKSVQEGIVIEVKEVLNVSNNSALNKVTAVDNGIKTVASKSNFQKPLNQIGTFQKHKKDYQ